MLAESRTYAVRARLVAGLILLAPAVAFGVAAEQASQPARGARPSADARAAILRGRVTNEAGAPLADVRVRVAIPATDMRFIDDNPPGRQLEARTDARGDYRLEIPGLAGSRKASLDAMKPGYRRLVGTLMSGGDPKSVELVPGAEAEASLILKPALYVAGKVVDEKGRPIPAAKISANAASAFSVGGVERIASRPDGSFEIFSYPEQPADRVRTSKGLVIFSHPDFVDARIEDIYSLEPEKRGALRVVLPTGCKVSGRVLDAAGKPVPKATVKAVRKDSSHRKATMTDSSGKFALKGLSPGLTLLSVRSLEIKQKAQLPLALNGDRMDLDLRLRPITVPSNLEAHAVLGMRLTDVTPELKSAYDLFNDRGALILDPGKDSGRLKIGKLAEGYVFWMVGNKRIGSVREFVDRILAETAGQAAPEYRVRVVYTFSTVDFDGTNTQYLRLTNDDLKTLRAVSDQLTPDVP